MEILNMYELFKITWGEGWLFLLMLIPFVNIIIEIMTCHKLSKAFGKDIGYTLGLIFLPYIFTLILGFGDAQYQGVPGKSGTVPNAQAQNHYTNQNYAPQNQYASQNNVSSASCTNPYGASSAEFTNQKAANIHDTEVLQNAQEQVGKVTCVSGLSAGAACALQNNTEIVIGRDPSQSHIVINNPRVSKRHCTICYNAATNRYIVVDHSSNGTYINGARIQNNMAIELSAGSTLQIADQSEQILLG